MNYPYNRSLTPLPQLVVVMAWIRLGLISSDLLNIIILLSWLIVRYSVSWHFWWLNNVHFFFFVCQLFLQCIGWSSQPVASARPRVCNSLESVYINIFYLHFTVDLLQIILFVWALLSNSTRLVYVFELEFLLLFNKIAVLVPVFLVVLIVYQTSRGDGLKI